MSSVGGERDTIGTHRTNMSSVEMVVVVGKERRGEERISHLHVSLNHHTSLWGAHQHCAMGGAPARQ